MSYVQFDEPNYGHSIEQQDSWLTRWVLKLGLAKSKKQVPTVLMIMGIMALIIMFVVGFGGSAGDEFTGPDPDSLIGR